MFLYRVLADLIVAVHFVYVTFVVVGIVLILVGAVRKWQWIRNFWFRAVHFLMIAVVVVESLLGIVCPLTEWEYQLRLLGGEEGEPGSFVGRLFHDAMFFEAPEWAFTVGYCLFGLAVLAALYWAPPRRPHFHRRAHR
jgi:hypothetical protein